MILELRLRGGAAAARVTHNHEVAGSSPAPATNFIKLILKILLNSKEFYYGR